MHSIDIANLFILRHGNDLHLTNFDITASAGSSLKFDLASAFFAGAQSVQKKWPNALRLLEDA